jgi:hypothetical protein
MRHLCYLAFHECPQVFHLNRLLMTSDIGTATSARVVASRRAACVSWLLFSSARGIKFGNNSGLTPTARRGFVRVAQPSRNGVRAQGIPETSCEWPWTSLEVDCCDPMGAPAGIGRGDPRALFFFEWHATSWEQQSERHLKRQRVTRPPLRLLCSSRPTCRTSASCAGFPVR